MPDIDIAARHVWEAAGTFTWGRTVYQLERNVAELADGVLAARYRLTGPRGAQYALLPNAHRPEMLFVINERRFTGTHPFRGGWFTDRTGELVHVS